MIYMNFDNGAVIMTKAPNYKRVDNYTVIYGLQIKTHKSDFKSAFSDFQSCVAHARNCEGLNDD